MSESSKELVKHLQKISFQILCDIDKYCTDNNILYFLSGGTCLGAVRHQGFIPWDDDVDIMLPRPDYEKFIAKFGMAFPDKYKVGSLETDDSWLRPYARVWDVHTELVQTKLKERKMGVFVDVFPIDGLPDSKLGQRFFYFRLKVLNSMKFLITREDFYEGEKYRVIKRILGVIIRPFKFNPRRFVNQMDKEAKKYNFERSKYVAASLSMHYWSRETIKKELMDRAVYLTFEDRKFPVPVGYKQYLRNLYGDYMTIPKDAKERGYSHLDGWTVKIN